MILSTKELIELRNEYARVVTNSSKPSQKEEARKTLDLIRQRLKDRKIA